MGDIFIRTMEHIQDELFDSYISPLLFIIDNISLFNVTVYQHILYVGTYIITCVSPAYFTCSCRDYKKLIRVTPETVGKFLVCVDYKKIPFFWFTVFYTKIGKYFLKSNH